VVKEQKEQVLGRPVGTHGMPAAAVVLWVYEDMKLGKARGMGTVVRGAHKARVKAVAKLEQMGEGAQLHHKYSDPCDVQTSSMTNSQF